MKFITSLLITISFCSCLFCSQPLDSLKAGIKLKAPFLEASGNIKIEDFTSIPEDYNYGISLFTDHYLKKFPCSIKFGTLSINGSYSKLNSPLLSSSISPFSNASTTISSLTATLPGSSSFSNNPGIFLSLGTKDSKKLLNKANIAFAYIPATTAAIISTDFLFNHKKLVKTAGSLTAGYFPYEENTYNSWFSITEKYFHQGNHFCINLQNSIQTSRSKNLISINLYQSPFKTFNWIFRSENSLNLRSYNLNFSALYNGNLSIVTCDQQINTPCLQTKTGINKKFLLSTEKLLFLKTGFAVYTDYDLQDQSILLKLATGGTLSAKLTSVTLNLFTTIKPYTDSNSISLQATSYGIKFSNSWNLKKVSPVVSGNISYAPDNSHLSQNYSLNLSSNKNPKVTLKNTFSIDSYTEKATDFKETSSLKINFSKSCFTCFCYLSMIFFADS